MCVYIYIAKDGGGRREAHEMIDTRARPLVELGLASSRRLVWGWCLGFSPPRRPRVEWGGVVERESPGEREREGARERRD